MGTYPRRNRLAAVSKEQELDLINPRTVNVKAKRAARLARKAKNRQQRHMRKLAA